jgi:hypothetical protein
VSENSQHGNSAVFDLYVAVELESCLVRLLQQTKRVEVAERELSTDLLPKCDDIKYVDRTVRSGIKI